ncbi:unnamed protein product [Phytophthora fragariaefolia]|uniref:Unnamed protein product n=1 Tax=Phytophthora fragariaefolia TaxID=1490495 RepID=A0A9W6TWM9_9STRA|nr:unnamed protein product [Phytophthora fragariaefolia]
MSEDERGSDDSDEDLFGSEGGEIENSVDLPALSVESLSDNPPLNTDDTNGDNCAIFERTGCDVDHDYTGRFSTVEEYMAIPNPLHLQTESPDKKQERDFREDSIKPDDKEQTENEFVSADKLHPSIDEGDPSLVIPEYDDKSKQCSIPVVSNDNEEQVSLVQDTNEVLREDARIQNSYCNGKFNEIGDPSSPSGTVSKSKIVPQVEPDDIFVESTSPGPNPLSAQHESEDTTAKPHLNEGNQQQQSRDVKDSPQPPSETLTGPMYTVEALFPVVYERSASLCSNPNDTADVASASASAEIPNRGRRRPDADKSLASRLKTLQSQLDTAHIELVNATRSFKLQISMVKADQKKLLQRNARLKKQLSMTIADLQRSNAENAKLKTENELYAAKLPRLQAELLNETSQVDERQAESVQTQLALTQLKARSQVLQTRSLALEAQNGKLTQQIREFQQQLQRKAVSLQQHTERTTKVEAELNELKSTLLQQKLDWKTRMVSSLQRFERDKAKLEAALKIQGRKELREAKERAEKASKRRQAAETSVAKLEEQLKQCKHELSSVNEANHHHVSETRTLEALIRKAHRTEATLRNDLAACKSKLRSLQDEKKRLLARPTNLQTRHRQLKQQIPVELLLPLTDDSSEDEDNQDEQCCSHCTTTVQQVVVCNECPQLRDQIHRLQKDLRRVRSLHTAELNAQASVLDALLKANK